MTSVGLGEKVMLLPRYESRSARYSDKRAAKSFEFGSGGSWRAHPRAGSAEGADSEGWLHSAGLRATHAVCAELRPVRASGIRGRTRTQRLFFTFFELRAPRPLASSRASRFFPPKRPKMTSTGAMTEQLMCVNIFVSLVPLCSFILFHFFSQLLTFKACLYLYGCSCMRLQYNF